MSDAGIDIVIPHVNGNAPGYRERSEKWNVPWVPCQVRELGELRYVLRSIERFAPFVRGIVLAVQDSSHVPAWLDRTKIRVVHHDAFLPPDLLPTFHWATIVSHLYRIPALSEQFVIWEDDVLLGRTITRETLFDRAGLARTVYSFPVIPGIERFAGTYQLNLAHSRSLIRRRFARASCFVYPHIPLPASRTSWRDFMAAFGDDPIFVDTITRRSRGEERLRPTIDPTVVYANWIDLNHRHIGAARHYLSLVRPRRRTFGGYPVVNDVTAMRRHMARLISKRPTYININDNAYDAWQGPADQVNPESLNSLTETLTTLFPERSSFELAG